MSNESILDFSMKDINGVETPIRKFEGKVLLVVNVASKCGFTPQYKSLQTLYELYKDKGLEILGFPANDFLRQEPGTDAEIREFCSTTYSVTFPLFAKISVKGKDIHPLYKFLTAPATNPKFPGKIGWNFAKFLVDRTGSVIGRFEPKVDPLDAQVKSAIEGALAS
ncbi:MAG: glutathione peroxidase [Spirochaetia bacterium]